MTDAAQKVALPAFLKKRLLAFRVGAGPEQHYLLKDSRTDEVHKLEPWQFFILEILPGCEDYPKLLSVFEDRFGYPTSKAEVEALFDLIASRKLFGLSALSHPLLAEFNRNRSDRLDRVPGEEQQKQQAEAKAEASRQASVDVTSLPPGVHDVIGFDEAVKQKGWHLFNPKKLVQWLLLLSGPLKYGLYLLPLLFVIALSVNWKYFAYIEQDTILLFSGIDVIAHVVISLLTVNLFAVLSTLTVAQKYRGTVKGIGIVLYFGFFPRFCPYVGNVGQFSRRERLWLHGAPLLTRLALFSLATLLWFNTRGDNLLISTFSLTVVIAATLSFLITVNPLVKSNGYHLVSTLLDEPDLRKKAYGALLSKIKGSTYQRANQDILAAYALASTVFMLLIFGTLLLLLGRLLKMQLGGAGVLFTLFLAGFFAYRMLARFKHINQAHNRAVQFQRWRDRTLVAKDGEVKVEDKGKTRVRHAQRALLVALVLAPFLPYQYEPGGSFIIMPLQQQEITTDIGGIVNAIHFNSGDFIQQGSEIGSLSHSDALAQVNIYNAKVREQQAVIDELKSRPRPEEVRLAEEKLDVERVRTRFSGAKFERLEKRYNGGAVSFEDLDDARRQYEVDLAQEVLAQADLELVRLGATVDQIEAEEAKLQSLLEQRDYYVQRVEMSKFIMPFDGRLVTMHLQTKTGSYLEKGEPLALVENSGTVLAQLSIAEADIGYVAVGSEVRVRPRSYHADELRGKVVYVDSTVVKEKLGKVVHVTSELDNGKGLLKTGMTGYAKIQSRTLPVWRVLTSAIVRFYRVEIWSWLP